MAQRKAKTRYWNESCYICQRPALYGCHYCQAHNRSEYIFLTCRADGCHNVTRRRAAGHNLYYCPEHKHGTRPLRIQPL